MARKAAATLLIAVLTTSGVAAATDVRASTAAAATTAVVPSPASTPTDATVRRPARPGSVTEHPIDPALVAAANGGGQRGTQLVQVVRLVVTRAPCSAAAPGVC